MHCLHGNKHKKGFINERKQNADKTLKSKTGMVKAISTKDVSYKVFSH